MEITEESIESALKTVYVTVGTGGADDYGNLLTARGPVADAAVTARELRAALTRTAALREPGEAEEPGVTVTRGQLEAALSEFCVVAGDGRAAWTRDAGTVTDIARALHGQLAASGAARRRDDAPGTDPELSAMAVIVAVLDALDDQARHRACNWLAGRYGIA